MAVELGWLDANVFIHVLSPADAHYARCKDLTDALADGRAEGWVCAPMLHEVSYVLSRRQAFGTRAVIATYLLEILNALGVHAADKDTLIATVNRWGASASIGFVDAYLAELAQRDGLPVCTVNARDFPTTPNSFATATF